MSQSERQSTRDAVNAIDLLEQDHRKVEKAFEKYEQLGPQAYVHKKELADSICEDLIIHTKIEEELFYPAVRKGLSDSRSLLNEAKVEHDSAKDLIKQIQAMGSDEELFDAKVKVLSEHIAHHVKEEEEEIFPPMRDSTIDMEGLGEKMQRRQQELH